MYCSLPGSSVHGILQARILEWIAVPSSRGSSWLRDWTWVSSIIGGFFTIWTTREAVLSVFMCSLFSSFFFAHIISSFAMSFLCMPKCPDPECALGPCSCLGRPALSLQLNTSFLLHDTLILIIVFFMPVFPFLLDCKLLKGNTQVWFPLVFFSHNLDKWLVHK